MQVLLPLVLAVLVFSQQLFAIDNEKNESVSVSATCPLAGNFMLVTMVGGGLCNALGILMGSLAVQSVNNNTIPYLMVAWDPSRADHFYELFQPIKNLLVIEYDLIDLYKDSAVIVVPNYVFYDYFNVARHYSGWKIPMNEIDIIKWRYDYYSKLHLTVDNEYTVKRFIQSNNITAASAIHVRRTDHNTPTTDEEFDVFIKSRPVDEKIFLLTDNDVTRQKYVSQYGQNKLITFGEIVGNIGGKRSRHTSSQHAIIEIFIASCAVDFMGSAGSSFSETIRIFRTINQNMTDFCTSSLST